MANKKFIQITEATDITDMSYFVGTLDNGDGTSTDYRFSKDLMIASVLTSTRLEVAILVTGSDLSDPWFDGKEITELAMNNQTYLRDEDFTQLGDTITMIAAIFISGRKCIAKL